MLEASEITDGESRISHDRADACNPAFRMLVSLPRRRQAFAASAAWCTSIHGAVR